MPVEEKHEEITSVITNECLVTAAEFLSVVSQVNYVSQNIASTWPGSDISVSFLKFQITFNQKICSYSFIPQYLLKI